MSFFLFCSFLFKKRVFVKIVQTECNQVLLELLRCRQSYAKIVQTECNQVLFELLRCRQSYAKIVQIERKMSSLLGYFTEVPTILCKDTKKPIYIGMKLPKLFKISNLSIKIKVFAFFILYCARLALSLHNLCKTNYGYKLFMSLILFLSK